MPEPGNGFYFGSRLSKNENLAQWRPPRAFVRHAELVRVDAHAGDAGHSEVEGRHGVAQLPREGQDETAQACVRVARYTRTAGNLPAGSRCAQLALQLLQLYAFNRQLMCTLLSSMRGTKGQEPAGWGCQCD